MLTLALALLAQASPLQEAAAALREKGESELRAGRFESADVLLSLACWMGEEAREAEAEAFRKLRSATSLSRDALDLSAFTDSPWDGYVARLPGGSKDSRTRRNSALVVRIDGERLTLSGTKVVRRREKPGEFNADRIVLVSDDEVLFIEGKQLTVGERTEPGGFAGKLLASKDARERSAGSMLYGLKAALRALQRLNDHRLAAGVAPVGYSAELSYGCALHARYLASEDPARTVGMAMHDEWEGSSWRTEAGLRAARQSCVSTLSLDLAVEQLMATLYHRVPMMSPGLDRVGLAQDEKEFRWFSLIDVQGSKDGTTKADVTVPASGQTGVPLRFASAEVPSPLPPDVREPAGYPITLSWYGGGEATAALKETKGGTEVACWISSPKDPANAARPDNAWSVCLIPKQPLKSKTGYTVTVESAGRTWSWSFTTR